MFFKLYDKTNLCHMNSLSRLCRSYGSTFFSNISPDSAEYAHYALLIITFLSNSKDLKNTMKCFLSLSQSPNFSVLIAASRIYHPDEFSYVLKLIQSSIPSFTQFMSISMSSIQNKLFAPFSQHPTSFIYLAFNDFAFNPYFSLFVASCLQMYLVPVSLLYNSDIHIQNSIFLSLIYSFYQYPSLSGAYIITNKFPSIQSQSYDPYSFHRAQFDSFLEGAVKWREELMSFNPSYFPEPILDPIYFTQFTTIPSLDGLEKRTDLFNLVLKYPALSPYIIPIRLKSFESNDLSIALEISTQILNNPYDFISLLHHQGSFEYYEISLSEFIMKNSESWEERFFEIFLLEIMTVFRFSWGERVPKVEDMISKTIEHLPSPISRLIQYILRQSNPYENCSQNLIKDSFSNSISSLILIDQIEYTIKFLCDNGNISDVLEYTKNHPIFFLPLLMWADVQHDPKAILIMKTKFPDYPLYSFLFFFSMMQFADNSFHAFSEMKYTDYDMLLQFQQNQNVITHSIFMAMNIINHSSGVSEYMQSQIRNIVIAFRAWAHVLGIEKFIILLLKVIQWDAIFPKNDSGIFYSIAFLLSMTYHEDDQSYFQILELCIHIVYSQKFPGTDETFEIIDTEGFAMFFVFLYLLISNQELKKKVQITIIDLIIKILNEKRPSSSSLVDFALELIKLTNSFPSFRKLYPESLPHLLVQRHSYRTLIDYYIARANDLYPTSISSSFSEN